jgi:hypothetical protein
MHILLSICRIRFTACHSPSLLKSLGHQTQMHECVCLHCFKWLTSMYENSIKLLRFSDQERAVKGETGEACAAPNHYDRRLLK